jgi:ABC-2 type transport system permease protein
MVSIQCRTLFKKEVMRFSSVWGQTLATPVLSSSLYLFIFGLSLGKQITMVKGFSYLEFIIPGLVVMGIINNSYQNTASSILISKFHGNIHDLLVAPISYLETVAAFTAGALVRGLLVGLITYIVSLFFKIVPVHNFPFLVAISVLTSVIFSQVGMIAAIFSESFDRLSMITNYVLMPLTYLSGVFYSIKILPPFWGGLSKFNPLFYVVDSFRFEFLGISDINPVTGFIVTLSLSIFMVVLTTLIFRAGFGLRK